MTTRNVATVNTGDTRVWLYPRRAGPANVPDYLGCAKPGSISKPRGEPTIVTCPSSTRFGQFDIVDKIPGEIGLGEVTITARYQRQVSELLAAFNRGCDVDVQMHIGKCKSPQDLNGGWEKILVVEAAQPGDWAVADFGALDPADNAPIMEEMPFRGEQLYEIAQVAFEEQAATEIVQEILAVIICDAVSCGSCDDPSDGCEKVFGLTITVGGSPGAAAEVIFTKDGGTTWNDTEIDTLPVDEDPVDFACVGDNLVVISTDSDSLHYASKADILAAVESWVEMATGFVAAGSPVAIFSLTPRHTWIVGEGGYVYFTQDPTTSVTVQTAGTVTTENLLALHGYDTQNIVAVGASNALIVSRNGGATWSAVTGPNVGINLTTVWMRGPNEWLVGSADGTAYYTVDEGVTWVQITLPGQSQLTNIADIKFSTPTVGWMAADALVGAAVSGRIFRTIDGGNSWYVAPEGNRSLPGNDSINEIAVCDGQPNVIYAGGLADNGTDGYMVKGA